MLCDGRRAWLLVQSRLTALLASLIARRWVGLQTEWWYHPKPYLRVARAVGGWHPFRVVLGWACRGLADGFLLLQSFGVAISVSPHVCFVLVLILISMFLGWCVYGLGVFRANRTTRCLRSRGRTKGEGWSAGGWLKPPSNFYCWPSQGGSSALVLWWF